MIYVNGLGYVDETVYQANSINNINTNTGVSGTNGISFDAILQTETANLQKNTTEEKTLKEIFAEASEKYHVSQSLLEAIAYHESRFQADVTSSSGAMGIMQLMPSTAKAMGVNNAYDPYENIMGGAKLLSKLSDMYNGNEKLMIAAYNAGSGNVAKYGGVPPFKGVQSYVAKVMDTMNSGVTVPGTKVATSSDSNAATQKIDSKTGNSKVDNSKTNDSKADKTNSVDAKTAGSNSVDTNTDTRNRTTSMYRQGIGYTSDLFSSSRLDERFSYDEYKLLMQYYDEMLKIISMIGDTDDSDNSDDTDDSLADLYKLDMQQRLGTTFSQSTYTNAAEVAATYASVSKLL